MKTTKTIMLILCISGLLATSALADIPHLIGYQGRLTDAAGDARQGSISITFRIYDAESAGNLLWNETHANVSVTDGIFDVMLGGVTPLDLPFDKQYYLAIQVGGDPEMTPRQTIASVGYAYRAEVASRVTIPLHRTGVHINKVDTQNVRLTPGVIDITGNLFNLLEYSPDIDLTQSSSYIEETVAPSGSWIYIYLYDNNGTVVYKASTANPDKSYYDGSANGTMRYYTPDGVAYYRCVAWCYKDNTGNIAECGNLRDGDAANIVKAVGDIDIVTNALNYEDMGDMLIHFVSSGKPVKISFHAIFGGYRQSEGAKYSLVIDGVRKVEGTFTHNDASYYAANSGVLLWTEDLAQGPNTFKIEWKKWQGTFSQRGETDGERMLIVEEM